MLGQRGTQVDITLLCLHLLYNVVQVKKQAFPLHLKTKLCPDSCYSSGAEQAPLVLAHDLRHASVPQQLFQCGPAHTYPECQHVSSLSNRLHHHAQLQMMLAALKLPCCCAGKQLACSLPCCTLIAHHAP